jgi:hypothetical protein
MILAYSKYNGNLLTMHGPDMVCRAKKCAPQHYVLELGTLYILTLDRFHVSHFAWIGNFCEVLL